MESLNTALTVYEDIYVFASWEVKDCFAVWAILQN